MKRLKLLIVFFFAANICMGQQSSEKEIIPSPSNFFEFHNGIWTNLHHFLYVQARARMNTSDSERSAVVGVKKDLERVSQMTRSDREVWNKALKYYQDNLAEKSILFDSAMNAQSGLLLLQENAQVLTSEKLDPEFVSILNEAAKVYRSEWWPNHQKSNRKWVEQLNPLLKSYEQQLSSRLGSIYDVEWPSTALRVDVCAYTNWAGAYSTWPPQRIAFSSLGAKLGGSPGLETLFHEALHFLERKFSRRLWQKTRSLNKRIPAQFTHAIIFYSAGESVRELIPDHEPYAKERGIWNRQPWTSNLEIIEAHWKPYLKGEITLEESIERMANSF